MARRNLARLRPTRNWSATRACRTAIVLCLRCEVQLGTAATELLQVVENGNLSYENKIKDAVSVGRSSVFVVGE